MRTTVIVLLAVLFAAVTVGCRPGSDRPAEPTASTSSPGSAGGETSSRTGETTSPTKGSTPGPTAGTTPAPTSARPGGHWTPRPGTPWQWQLTTPVDVTVDAPVYDIDGHENPASVVAELHAKGRKVICYVNTGAAEDFRPDHAAFPPSVLGGKNGWKGEHWVDIRQRDVLRPIMAARFDECQRKGFDAVEADLVDGYKSTTGFPLTGGDQLAYNRMLADLAHERGMTIGLKNDLDQIPDLVGTFDFSVNEQCAEFDECQQLAPFIRAGKAVFHVEYNLGNDEFCGRTTALRFSSMRKNLDLDAARWPC